MIEEVIYIYIYIYISLVIVDQDKEEARETFLFDNICKSLYAQYLLPNDMVGMCRIIILYMVELFRSGIWGRFFFFFFV
jgi:hypothetical protein